LQFKGNGGQIVRETLSQKNPSQKVLVEWLKVKALSSNPSTTKKKNHLLTIGDGLACFPIVTAMGCFSDDSLCPWFIFTIPQPLIIVGALVFYLLSRFFTSVMSLQIHRSAPSIKEVAALTLATGQSHGHHSCYHAREAGHRGCCSSVLLKCSRFTAHLLWICQSFCFAVSQFALCIGGAFFTPRFKNSQEH
jgi:hypothetical protein